MRFSRASRSASDAGGRKVARTAVEARKAAVGGVGVAPLEGLRGRRHGEVGQVVAGGDAWTPAAQVEAPRPVQSRQVTQARFRGRGAVEAELFEVLQTGEAFQ